MAKLKIWTLAYRPFVMGGRTNYSAATELEVSDPVTIREPGIKVCESDTPRGKRVALYPNGAIVGDSIEEVTADLTSAPAPVIEAQLWWAAEEAAKAELMSNEQFFNIYR